MEREGGLRLILRGGYVGGGHYLQIWLLVEDVVRLEQETRRSVDCGERAVKRSTVRDDSFTIASSVDHHKLCACQHSGVSDLR